MANPLKDLKHVHIIGVGGTLMGAFAAFLKRAGIRVTGTDNKIYPPMSDILEKAGIEVYTGYNSENIFQFKEKPDWIVVGNVITPKNVEAQFAINQGYRYTSLPEFMEKVMLKNTRNIVVSGTHGKTTTSCMLAHVLNQCGKNPNYFIGGVSQDLPHSFHVSSLEHSVPFVIEGDEYDTAFWDKVPKFNHYLPDDVILTSVEYDHADIYPDMSAVIRAFDGLVSRVRPGGRMIVCVDYPPIPDLVMKSRAPVITYSAKNNGNARFAPANVRVGETTTFDVMENGKKRESLEIGVPGEHNVLNALAVWIQTQEMGIPSADVRAALKSFKGVKRRQEVRGEIKGITVIDDFAHHPTAVRETVKALKQKYSGRRLVVVFEPRSATSRRKVFQKAYAESFEDMGLVFIAKPYDQSTITSNDQFSSDQLVDDINKRGVKAQVMKPVAEGGVEQVAASLKSGDVVAVLSNGGFDGFIGKLLDQLKS
ncbi:MAG: hypothetical protein KA715_05745 [Xanthomonadaceae bacterium]|nr:hypothetical protein [Xanthomonadaceae bacterium]